MCRVAVRKTPFNFTGLGPMQRLILREGSYACNNITNHALNAINLRNWTTAHKQAWELEQINNPGPISYNLTPYGLD